MLYICPTPIGNLEDITIRVLNTLKDVDYIACEDTRRTIKLLNHYGISKKLISFNQHTEFSKKNTIIEDLVLGKNIALVSDAGMPGIQDPGRLLIKSAIEHKIPYTVLPGATAFVTALVGSGLCEDEFLFLGFLPRKDSDRRATLKKYIHFDREIVLYEAPHRLKKLLETVQEIYGNRQIVISREVSKKHEEYLFTSVEEAIEKHAEVKGELVIIIQRKAETETTINEAEIRQRIEKYLQQGMRTKELTKQLVLEMGIAKNYAYEMILKISKETR